MKAELPEDQVLLFMDAVRDPTGRPLTISSGHRIKKGLSDKPINTEQVASSRLNIVARY